ncbi:MAG: M14 family metallopeptidase [Xanthomonadaceae bacterium]|nr:M14 family metallopeptidase [Xanthomonadaceae bacterium]
MPSPLRLAAALIPILSIALTHTLPAHAAKRDDALSTLAERSSYARTGRYDETIALCAAFAVRYPERVRCIDFGVTPEGRPMKALVVTATGAFEPAAARADKRPVLLIQGGIHAGEIDGKDAGFLALRQILEGKAARDALEKLVLIFVPVFNVDGHERFKAWNRPNQNGPAEMGWRTTAQNYNLNRDYVKADAPEMRAMLALVNAWDPIATVDLHVTDGAKFEHDISIIVEPIDASDTGLRVAGRTFRDETIAALTKQGSLPVPFYPSFDVNDDPTSGFTHGVATPRFSTGYFHLRNRLGMLVETHSWKDYPTRVRITRNTFVAAVESTANHGARWRALADEADRASSALGGRSVALDYVTSKNSRIIDFRGYAYTRTPSEVSGATMTRYDDTKPQIWKLPLRDEIAPGRTVAAPKAGYLVPAAHADMVARKLAAHGIEFSRLERALATTRVEGFRAEKTTYAASTVEGHHRLTVEGRWAPENRDIGAGALFVPIAQAKARLVVAMLEPQAPDSILAWGGFNNAFEQKEYMEDYVAEEVAREMLAKDPTLRAEFERKLKDDAGFAGDPAQRLEFFYRRHSAWDERFGLYPIFRIDTAP